MFIVPMDAEGVTVRGLRQISGEAEFNEVFFDDVRLAADAVVGPVDDGWGTALTMLMFERLTIGLGSEGMGYRADRFAEAIAGDADARRDPEVRQRLGEIAVELLADQVHRLPHADRAGQGPDPGPGGGPGQGHDGQRRDRRRRPDRRRARPRRARRGRRVGLHDLVPARAEVRGRDRGDPAQHDRRARARPAARAAPGQGHARSASCAPRRRRPRRHEPRAVRRAGVPARGRARRAVARQDDRGRARGARGRRRCPTCGRPRSRPAGPACWSTRSTAAPGSARSTRCSWRRSAAACWPARRCSGCCRRPRCCSAAGDESLEAVAAGDLRPAWLPARPPGDLVEGWTVDARSGQAPRGRAARDASTATRVTLHRRGRLGARRAGRRPARRRRRRRVDGAPVAVAVDAGAAQVEAVTRYDADPLARPRDASTAPPAGAWTSPRSSSAARGTWRRRCSPPSRSARSRPRWRWRRVRQGALHVRARDRLLPGGQARADRGPAPPGERPLAAVSTPAGPSTTSPRSSPLAASAARSAAGAALDFAARQIIITHGGIGATWEHDAPLFFRRAQLSRRLLGGTGDATDRVAEELLAAA